MEEGPSNGGLLYHEVQEAKLCAVHCVNTILQGPFFSPADLAALATDIDHTELQVMSDAADSSQNVSVEGNFSIQVLQKALGVWNLQVIPLNSPEAEASNSNPELENAFMCHLHDHWFCIRKVNGEWYNFNSLFAAPELLSNFYLSAFLDTLKASGWSIFLVRGNFPKECMLSSSGFGQWLTREDAERITKSCNERQVPPQRQNRDGLFYLAQIINDADVILTQEELDQNAVIAAIFMDTSAFAGEAGSQSGAIESGSNLVEDENVAIATGSPSQASDSTAGVIDKDNLTDSAAVDKQSGVKGSGDNLVERLKVAVASSPASPSLDSLVDVIDKINPIGSAAVASQYGVEKNDDRSLEDTATLTAASLIDPSASSKGTGIIDGNKKSGTAAIVSQPSASQK